MSSLIPTLKRIWFFIKRSWFVLTIILVILLFFLGDQPLKITSIVILSITIAGLVLQIVLTMLKFKSFKTYLESHKRIDDTSIAHGLSNELVTIRRQLSELMKDEKCPGLIILLKNTYIYYNSNTLESFKKLYEGENFNDKVYTLLSKHYNLQKHEVQAIRKRLEEIMDTE